MRLRYEASSSSNVKPSSSSAAAISCAVAPAAPLYVIPSAIATLSGETKRLESADTLSAIWRNSLKAKALSAVTRRPSAAVSSRGRCVISEGAVGGASRHCAAASPIAANRIGRKILAMGPPSVRLSSIAAGLAFTWPLFLLCGLGHDPAARSGGAPRGSVERPQQPQSSGVQQVSAHRRRTASGGVRL